MHNKNTIVYVKVKAPRPADFVDPTPFEWNQEKEKQLWGFISKLDNHKEQIDWNQLSATFEAPVYFLKRRSYKLFAMHLELLQLQITEKQRMIENEVDIAASEISHLSFHSESTVSFYKDKVSFLNRKGETDHESDTESTNKQAVKHLQTSRILNYRNFTNTDGKNEELNGIMRNNDSDNDLSSSLSVSKSALEEALIARLNF